MFQSGFTINGNFVKDDRMPLEKGYLTITETADLMVVSRQAIWNWVKADRLKKPGKKIFPNAYKMPGGLTSEIRIPVEDVLPYLPQSDRERILSDMPKKKARPGRKA